MSTATIPSYIQYNEKVVGENSPLGLVDVANRLTKFLINQSDLVETDPFPGFLGRYLNAGTPEAAVVANVGVACFDTTNGDLYIKKTGVGNTGWQLVGGSSSVAAGTIGQLSKFLSATKVGDSLVSEVTGITVAVGANAIVENFAAGTLTKAASGTHALFAGAQFNPPTINAGAATLTAAATVYISGAPAVGSSVYALWVASGSVVIGTDPGGTDPLRIGGNVTINSPAGNPQLTFMQAGASKFALFEDSATSEFRLYSYALGGPAVISIGGTLAINQQTSAGPHVQLNFRINGADKWAWYALNEDGTIRLYDYTAAKDIIIVTGSTNPSFRLNGAQFGQIGLRADWNAVDALGFENSGAGTYATWRVGPGAGNGLNEFNWYNSTAAAIEFGITNTGILKLPQASIANGAGTVTITNVRPAAAASATITGWVKMNIGGTDRYIPYWS